MPGCQGSGFIEEEEFRVSARRHHRPLSAPELQKAYDPPFQLPRPFDTPFGVVKDTSVAHECSSIGCRNQIAERRDTVLSRHCPFSLSHLRPAPGLLNYGATKQYASLAGNSACIAATITSAFRNVASLSTSFSKSSIILRVVAVFKPLHRLYALPTRLTA